MEVTAAVTAFSALSQETRLSVLRWLVKAGPKGVSAGALADELGVAPSNLSFHLKELTHAGLVTRERSGRHIVYSADYDCLTELLGFLMNDCCGRRPEICAPFLTGGASLENETT